MADVVYYCEQCGKEIEGSVIYAKHKKFCSDSCRDAWLMSEVGQYYVARSGRSKFERTVEEMQQRRKKHQDAIAQCLWCPYAEPTCSSTLFCMFPHCPRDDGSYGLFFGD